MTEQIRPIPLEAVARALTRAERYRLLNEPREAESICRDVLAVDPGNRQALVTIILAITDLFREGEATTADVQPHLARLESPLDRAYYAGVAEERWAKVLLRDRDAKRSAADYLRTAMRHYDAAQRLAASEGREEGSQWDAVLRWNTCVRIIERHGLDAVAALDGDSDAAEEDVPMR
jgi:hypothetical protein